MRARWDSGSLFVLVGWCNVADNVPCSLSPSSSSRFRFFFFFLKSSAALVVELAVEFNWVDVTYDLRGSTEDRADGGNEVTVCEDNRDLAG